MLLDSALSQKLISAEDYFPVVNTSDFMLVFILLTIKILKNFISACFSCYISWRRASMG